MTQEQFTHLFEYIERRFDRIDLVLEQKADRTDLSKIENATDHILKHQAHNSHQRIVLIRQTDEQE